TTRAWDLWRGLERRSGGHLLPASGVVSVAAVGDAAGLVPATLEAAARYGVPVEHLDAAALRQRWPALTVADGWEGVFEPEAGFVDPVTTVRVLQRLAVAARADLRAEPVRS